MTNSPQKRLAGRDRTAQIRERATQLFADHGVKRVTMKQIAQRCGITEAALYRHYRSKEAIYESVIHSLGRRLCVESGLAEIDQTEDPREILSSLARLVLDTLGRQPAINRLLLHCSLDRHPLCAQAFQDLRGPFVTFLASKLRRMIRAGRIRRVQPDITARCFVGMVMDCCVSLDLWGGFQERSFDPEQVVQNNVSILVEGLAPRNARPVPQIGDARRRRDSVPARARSGPGSVGSGVPRGRSRSP
jgi:AcrR family transcriptional regulator